MRKIRKPIDESSIMGRVGTLKASGRYVGMNRDEHNRECAREARRQAALLAPGPVRDALLAKIREYEAEMPAMTRAPAVARYENH